MGLNGKNHSIAVWAGVAAFFANVIALKIVDVFSSMEILRFVGVLVASIFVGAAVYTRQRLDDARMDRLEKARKEHWVIQNEVEKEDSDGQ